MTCPAPTSAPPVPDDQCADSTAWHDGLDVRRYWAPLYPGMSWTLCSGCARNFAETIELRVERRAEPVREAWPRMHRRVA